MKHYLVTPAQAGVPLFFTTRSGIPAFAGMTKWLGTLLFVLLTFIAAPAAAQNFPEHGGSPVVDQADLLRPEQELDLKSKSEALHAQTGRSLVVATVKSLDGLTVEDYSTQLFRKWAIGDKKLDNGVLLLVAPNERKVRIETGYGAEGFLPDILAGRIIRNTILPKFRDGDMPGGIMAGADAIIQQISLPPDQAQANVAKAQNAERRDSRRIGVGNIIPAIIIAIIFFSIIGSIARRTGGRRYRRHYGGAPGINPWIVLWGLNELSRGSRGGGGWGGGGWSGGGSSWGGGGGFGGFGGGSSGGGGASGGW